MEPQTDQIFLIQHCSDQAGRYIAAVSNLLYCKKPFLSLSLSLSVFGRFDRLVYLGVSEDMEAKMKILNAITRK